MDTNTLHWNDLQFNTGIFSVKLKQVLEKLGIYQICTDLEIDHICVRLKKPETVESLKNELLRVGQLISSVNVNGREISIFQLKDPLMLGAWKTHGVELPYPKPDHSYSDGWEHAEFVLKGLENTMSEVRKMFFRTFTNLDIEELKLKYHYSEDEPNAEGDQTANPTIGLKIDGVGIKFHASPIQTVVRFQ